jgi:hypothetical protein
MAEFNDDIKRLRKHFKSRFLKQALASSDLTTEDHRKINTWYGNQISRHKLKDRVLDSIRGNPDEHVENWFHKNYRSIMVHKGRYEWKQRLSFFKDTRVKLAPAKPAPHTDCHTPESAYSLTLHNHNKLHICIAASDENMARQTHLGAKMEFLITKHGCHYMACDAMLWCVWNPVKWGVRPVENFTKHKDYEQCWRLCTCAGPPQKNINRRETQYRHWGQTDGYQDGTMGWSYQRKKCVGDFYGSPDDKWDSFHFAAGFGSSMDPVLVNGNTLPSESWNTKAFFSKQFMAQRIVEIAFCAHVLGRLYGSDTADGTFTSRIESVAFNSQKQKYEEFKRKRRQFLVMVKGANCLHLSTDCGDRDGPEYMCFVAFFDPRLGYGSKSAEKVICQNLFINKVSALSFHFKHTFS